MNRVKQLLTQSQSLLRLNSLHFYMDPGSAMTKIALNRRVIYNQPTLMAVHQQSGSVLAVGRKVETLRGRVNEQIRVLAPIKDGAIIDNRLAKAYFRSVFEQVFKKRQVFNLKATVALPAFLSPVERSFYRQVFQDLNIYGLTIWSCPQAIGQFLKQTLNIKDICILDIGQDNTELSLLVEGNLLASKKISLGSQNFNLALKKALQRSYQLDVALTDIDRLKRQFVQVVTKKQRSDLAKKRVVVRGKDVQEGMIKTVSVLNSDLLAPLETVSLELIESIKVFLTTLPTEAVVAALQVGIYLSGGGSKIRGLKNFLSSHLKTEVIESEEAELDVIKGLYADY